MRTVLLSLALLSMTAASAAGRSHELAVENLEKVPIVRLFASEPNADDWGDDVLPVPVLQPGAKTTLHWQGDCVFDLRVVFPGAAEERRGVDLCSLGLLAITPGWTTTPIGPGERI